jgi:hypothetical protein
MNSFKLIFLAFVCALATRAQQTAISGVVTDPSGDGIAAVKVRASAANGGSAYSTLTNSTGLYRLPSLIAAEYVVRVDAPGFAPAERTVTVGLGVSLELNIELHLAKVTSTVEVSTSVDSLAITSSQVASNIDPRQMENIPLNGRNWMELSLLVPGITRNALNPTPVNGGDGGKFQLNVDGQQVTQNTAGSSFGQPGYSRDGVAEFQVVTNRFDATLGRSSRLQINAQTKSGTNQLHGTAYGYFRNDAFNAADPIAQRVLPYSDQQFGGTFGGPLIKDKLWFFGAYERERQPGTIFTKPTGFGGLSFTFPTKQTTFTYLGRLDYQKSDTDRFSLRFSGHGFDNPFTNVGGADHPSRATKSNTGSFNALITWTKVYSAALVNEFKVGFSYFTWGNVAIVPSQEYRLGVTTVGGPYNYPGTQYQDGLQFRDDLFWLKGAHSFKMGAEIIDEVHTGFFQQNVRGVVTSFSSPPSNLAAVFPTWNDPSTWNLAVLGQTAASFVQGFGNFDLDITRKTLGFWFQDDWKVSRRLTLNLGLRYDNDLDMLGSAPKLKSGLAVPTHGDNFNVAPRVGFVCDLFGGRKTLIRGGAGLYYADIQANQFYDQQLFNGQTTIQAAVQAKPGQLIDLTRPFGSATGADFVNGTIVPPSQAIQLVSPSAQTPYSLQVSIGAEHEIASNWTVAADYVHWRVYHEWMRMDQNFFYNPATGFNMNPATAGRPDPRFTSILRFLTPNAGGSLFDDFQMEVRRRFARGLMVAGSYTLSRLKDSTTGAFSVPNNPFNLAGEWSNGSEDQQHTLSVNGAYQLKWGFQLSGLYRFGSGSAFASTAAGDPFGAAGSNRTFLASVKTYNNPADNTTAPYAPGYLITKRNQLYGQPISRFDARLSKSFIVKERFRLIALAEAFNLLNRANFGAYGTVITSPNFGVQAQNLNLPYGPRMLQFAGRFEF